MPDGIPNVDSTVLKLAKQYHDCNVRSGAINDERKVIRENAEKLGIDPGAFQVGVRMAQAMTVGERSDFTGSLTRVLAALDGQESDLFGEEEMRKRDERKAKAADKAAKGKAPPADATDDNPRSDPKSGGAGGVKGTAPAKDAEPKKRGRPPGKKGGDNVVNLTPPTTLKQAVKQSDQAIKDSAAAIAEREQQEGGEILDGAVDKMKANGAGEPVDNDGDNSEPLSQSEQAARARESAGLN